MQHEYTISGMTCSGCASTVEKALASIENVTDVTINLNQSMATITMSSHVPTSILQKALSAFPTYQLSDRNSHHIQPSTHAQHKSAPSFWDDFRIWKRASLNTLNCLIGCSIGDFAMIVFLQAYYPGTPMITQMILATIAGLITSVMLETVLLKYREHFSWRFALQTAFAMSFLSMVAMELAMNTTDFMITGGKAAFENPMYWVALAVAMIVGFLVPLPYNYYKLKKFNKACH
jgi:cation transport ATPase